LFFLVFAGIVWLFSAETGIPERERESGISPQLIYLRVIVHDMAGSLDNIYFLDESEYFEQFVLGRSGLSRHYKVPLVDGVPILLCESGLAFRYI